MRLFGGNFTNTVTPPGTLLSFFAGILLQNHKGYDESMYVVAFEVSDTHIYFESVVFVCLLHF